MATNITRRDRVWAAVLEQSGEFRRRDVKRSLRYQKAPGEAVRKQPSGETVKRTLSAMVELEVLEHDQGSPYYRWREK